MGIDRVHTTPPSYTSLQRRSRVRKGKGSSDDDVADESQSEQGDERPDSPATGKRVNKGSSQDKASEDASQEDASDEDASDEGGGHIDEHV